MAKRKIIEKTFDLSKKKEVRIQRYQFRVNTKPVYSFDFKSNVTGTTYSVNGLRKEDLKTIAKAIREIDEDFKKL